MAWSDITNGESGSSVRTKLNALGADVDTKASNAFVGVRTFPVVPFTPLAGQNAIEWNSPLLNNGGFWSGANPTRITIPDLGANPVGVITGSIAYIGGLPTNVSIFLRLDGATVLEGSSAGLAPSPGRLTFTTGPREVVAGEYYELMYEFDVVTDKIIQIIGTSLTFHYVGED